IAAHPGERRIFQRTGCGQLLVKQVTGAAQERESIGAYRAILELEPLRIAPGVEFDDALDNAFSRFGHDCSDGICADRSDGTRPSSSVPAPALAMLGGSASYFCGWASSALPSLGRVDASGG